MPFTCTKSNADNSFIFLMINLKKILNLNIIAGTEITGAFFGKGMSKQFEAFMQSDDKILNAFCSFGEHSINPADLLPEIERYTCNACYTVEKCVPTSKVFMFNDHEFTMSLSWFCTLFL